MVKTVGIFPFINLFDGNNHGEGLMLKRIEYFT